MEAYIQGYSKLAIFNQIKNTKKLNFNDEKREVKINNTIFKKKNTFRNLLKFRLWRLLSLLFVLLITLYSFVQMNLVVGVKSTSYMVGAIGIFYILVSFLFILKIRKNEESKTSFIIDCFGIICVFVHLIFNIDSWILMNISNQVAIYHYFYILTFTVLAYYFKSILNSDYLQMKRKILSYYEDDRGILLIVLRVVENEKTNRSE